MNNSPLLRCWRPISPNGAAIIREILPTNNIHISFPKYYCSPLNLFTIFQIQPLSTERAFFVDPFTKFLNIHFLILEDVVAFETQEVGGCIDLQNTRRFPPSISFFCCCSEDKHMLLSAREAAAAWTDTASRLGLSEKAPVRGRGKACAMHYYCSILLPTASRHNMWNLLLNLLKGAEMKNLKQEKLTEKKILLGSSRSRVKLISPL